MKSQGSLACLLLALCLGSGEAGPLLRGGESAGAGAGEAVGQGVGDAISHGVEEAVGQGAGEAAGSATREVMGHSLGEAAHALGNTAGEAGRQVENIIRHGGDAVHSSWQGMPGSSGARPPSGGHGIFGSQGGSGGHSQGNPGGPGTPWGQGYPRGSDGSFGAHSQGGPWGQGSNGGSFGLGTNAQGTMVQPGYGSLRGSNSHIECTNPPPSGSGGSSSSSGGGSGGGASGGGGSSYGPSWDRPFEKSRNFDQSSYSGSEGHNTGSSWDSNGGSSLGSSGGGNGGGSGGGNKPGCDSPGNEVRISGGSGGQNSQTSPGLFNFDTVWKNFKSKLGFINWDAINKGQVPRPSTRTLLYFSRLWEDFKHNTPFLNWKAIIEGADASLLQKRSGSASQNTYNQQAYPTPSGGQYAAKIPSKGGATPSSSASPVRPGPLQWVKFW
ncbi:PREDICTED: uncharacterized protein LOC101377294 [Odobenus rosmarus divergens]|uniref:Uncharacterized protein LOC101377294 n=1 Tax=Odobenus rosmarus divergens TaxID=9708 RepID=A0A9B0HEY7_ODORO